MLKQAGCDLVKNPKESDIAVIFTCSVKTPTVQRMLHRIRELSKGEKPLVVAGCLPKAERGYIEKNLI